MNRAVVAFINAKQPLHRLHSFLRRHGGLFLFVFRLAARLLAQVQAPGPKLVAPQRQKADAQFAPHFAFSLPSGMDSSRCMDKAMLAARISVIRSVRPCLATFCKEAVPS